VSDILICLKAITTNGHTDAINFRLAGSHGADKIGVGHFAAQRDLVWFEEDHGVLADDDSGGRTIFG
jgi:hypothetical protein